MRIISAEIVNQAHNCYIVTQVADDTVEFTTDYGVEYQINFMADYSLWEENAYQFVIINKNRKASPSDQKMKNTLIAIVESFFLENTNILLYICETGDGKQAARSKLFIRWFSNYDNANEFYFKTTEIESEGVENFAAIIIKRNNPELDTIIQQFEDFVSLMTDKPE